jgi:hypothetical protein
MGIPRGPKIILEWQSTLGAIKQHGSSVAITGCKCPNAWRELNVDVLLEEMGADGWLCVQRRGKRTPLAG